MTVSATDPFVLAVDDKPANLLALDAVLEPLRVPLITATSGQDALRALLHHGERIAVILLDVQMPDIDGFETAKLIRARPLLRHVPIIFITAISREEAHIVKGYAHGAVDYLVKPFDAHLLRAKVEQFVDIQRRHLQLESDKREAEDRTRESEERLRMALDAAKLGIWGWDHDGSVFCDMRAAQLFGVDERASTDVVELGPGALKSDSRFELELRSAANRWVLIHGRAHRDERGRVLRILGTVEDISTARRQHEERELFLGALGHDLRNPLNAILMSADLLRRTDLPAVEHLATKIGNGARRMRLLVDDLLDFARSRVGALPVDPQLVDLTAICQDVITDVEAAHPGVQISLSSDGDSGGCWDPSRIGQIVQNLLTNAVRHGAPERPIDVHITVTGDDVILEVRNEGEPIPTALRRKIFEPFVAGTGSVGLGLYIAQQLVRAHHGRIDFVSNRTATTFRVTLPRQISLFAAASDCR